MRRLRDIILTIEDGTPIHLVEYACDSSEIANLPTDGIADGSFALTTDTAEGYFFNEASSEWRKA